MIQEIESLRRGQLATVLAEVIRITEKWTSLEALKAHFAAPHMADFQATMGAHPPVAMDVSFYEVEEIHPF